MKFLFIPNQSVDKIEFGCSRVEVRQALIGFKKEFKKNKFSKNTTDEFEYCHVFYDVNDKCNAIELFDTCELIYENKNLFKLSLSDFKELFPDMIEEYGSYFSKKYSVGVSFDADRVESILVGCKDYYM